MMIGEVVQLVVMIVRCCCDRGLLLESSVESRGKQRKSEKFALEVSSELSSLSFWPRLYNAIIRLPPISESHAPGNCSAHALAQAMYQ